MRTRRLVDREGTLSEGVNGRTEENYFDIIRRLGQFVSNPGESVGVSRNDHSGLFVPFAPYGGFTFAGTRGSLACAPGTTINKQVTVTGNLILSGAFLDCEENLAAIVVKDGGRVLLQNCHVSKKDEKQLAAADTYIHVEVGGYASINGCFFHGLQGGTGVVVLNDDAILTNRVAVVGCVNLTDIAAPYTNVGYSQDVP